MFYRLRQLEYCGLFVAFNFVFLLSVYNVPNVSCTAGFFRSAYEREEETDPLFAEMKAELAAQGPCWTYAVDRLEQSRNSSTSKERLAFDFTNCFLEGAGVSSYYCPESKELTTCTDLIRLRNSSHGHVYAVFYLQSQLLEAYLRELTRQREVSQGLTRLKSPPPLSSKLASISDTLLDSIQTQREMLELKRLAVKSQEELRKNMGKTRQVLTDIYDTVTNYQVFGVTMVGAALYATNAFLRVMF